MYNPNYNTHTHTNTHNAQNVEDEEGDFIDTEERVREVVATATSTVTC